MEFILRITKKLIPNFIFSALQPVYHYLFAFCSAVRFGSPSRKIFVVGVTGTKGKSSTTEIINALLEGAGYKTAMVNGIRFKVGNDSIPNKLKMTMPGRMLIQQYIKKAVAAKCDYFILEMTSEGAKQFRHKFLNLDTLIFTNISPEHIESHGSYEKYLQAKLSIAQELKNSCKRKTTVIANIDDKEGEKFLAAGMGKKISFSLNDLISFKLKDNGIDLVYMGEKYSSPLLGKFNLYNILAAMTFAKSIDVSNKETRESLKNFPGIRGRVEKVKAGQDFDVVVDYAHTADSLRQFYGAFEGKRKICVLGSCGGGRDNWKRPDMGAVADTFCDTIILANEDPYDEDPMQIINDVAGGIKNHKPIITLDRRKAIARALGEARVGDAVLITGKGTDPYIMEANGKKIQWDDATVAREELGKFLNF
ncbi:MAG: UDP-N-acetylmuramyl-tripeptide synthetase [Candidatus Pacebacteria bacterium]|nr:UDP-N-acetylmuramyl-tripeptide synthetase [Candidatus Paceibacterota bacterium]